MQRQLSRTLSEEISVKIGSDVRVDNVQIGLFNSVILTGVEIKDQNGGKLFSAKKVSAKIKLRSFLFSPLTIRTVELYDAQANLVKEKENSEYNFQFIVDSLSSPKQEKEKPHDIKVKSVILSRCSILHDVLEKPYRKTFDINHAALQEVDASIGFRIKKDGSVNIKLRNIAFKEKCGLVLKHGYLDASVGKHFYRIPALQIKTETSNIAADGISFSLNDKGQLSGRANIKSSIVSLKDVQAFVPVELPDETLVVGASVKVNENKWVIPNLSVIDKAGRMDLLAGLKFSKTNDFSVKLNKLRVKETLWEKFPKSVFPGGRVMRIVKNMGDVEMRGNLVNRQGFLSSESIVQASTGTLELGVKKNRDSVKVQLKSDNLKLGKLLSKEELLGQASFNANVCFLDAKNYSSAVKVFRLGFKKYNYKNITAELVRKKSTQRIVLSSHDNNADLFATVNIKDVDEQKPQYNLEGIIKKFSPNALNLSKAYPYTDFSAQLDAVFTGKDYRDFEGNVNMSNILVSKPDTAVNLGRLALNSLKARKGKLFTLKGDFGEAEIKGNFNFGKLSQDFLNVVNPVENKSRRGSDENDFDFNMHLKDAAIINLLANTDIKVEGENFLYGRIDSRNNFFQLELSAPNVRYNGGVYSGIGLFCKSDSNDTSMRFHASKKMEEGRLEIESTVRTKGYNLENSVLWKSTAGHKNSGEISQTITFPNSKENRIESVVHPSVIFLDDSLWRVSESHLMYDKGKLYISDLKFSQDDNELSLDGVVSKFSEDSLQAKLRNIRIQKVLDLVSFDDVHFDGMATGDVNIASVLNTPRVNASVYVDDFIFNHAPMGSLRLNSHWNNKENKIDISAIIRDNAYSTAINGYVSPADDYIDLTFGANGTNALFLNDFFPEAMQLSEGRTSGRLRLFGDLHAMNLEGTQIVSGLKLGVEPLGTQYTVKSDTVYFSHNLISFPALKLYDMYGNSSVMSGGVRHRDLHDFSYSMNIEPRNFLVYDRMQDGSESSFWGTAFVDGQIHLYGASGYFTTDANVTPRAKTLFVYNADQPESTDNVELLRFRNADAKEGAKDTVAQATAKENAESNDVGTDIRLNFNINVTPEAELRVIMDDKAGNMISTHGRGNINAHFYNKGNFEMFGVYGIDDGTYKIKFQDLIQKNFILRNGGRIAFNGNPLACALNLQAVYTIPTVSLAGISVQGSLRDNSVPVDCVMNITGSALQPLLNFDIDLPSVSADQKQMVRSLIATPEDMNMQAMYLLSVGRFYTYNYDMAASPQSPSQTSLAMNSFLSSTLSSNINNLLQSFGENNGNWSFGTNFATGNDGWNDMDVEGLFTGRLFKGRLLIDGNLGYRDKSAYNSNFVGDFTARYLLNSHGTIQLKAYNESNDRYFTKSTLTTQGGGIVFKRDFNNVKELFRFSKHKKSAKQPKKKDSSNKVAK